MATAGWEDQLRAMSQYSGNEAQLTQFMKDQGLSAADVAPYYGKNVESFTNWMQEAQGAGRVGDVNGQFGMQARDTAAAQQQMNAWAQQTGMQAPNLSDPAFAYLANTADPLGNWIRQNVGARTMNGGSYDLSHISGQTPTQQGGGRDANIGQQQITDNNYWGNAANSYLAGNADWYNRAPGYDPAQGAKNFAVPQGAQFMPMSQVTGAPIPPPPGNGYDPRDARYQPYPAGSTPGGTGGGIIGGVTKVGTPDAGPGYAAQLDGSGQYKTTSDTPASLNSVKPWYVTPEQTVAAQINALTDPNSGIIQQARAQALQQANARGLLNSNMALTAADAAAYQAAIPIAQADAATYAKAAGYNADASNQLNQLQYTQGNQVGLSREQLAQQLGVAQMQDATSRYGTDVSAAVNREQLANQWRVAQMQDQTSRYGTDVQANTNRYNTDSSANTNRYNTDVSAATSRYTQELNAQTQITTNKLDNESRLTLQREADANRGLIQTSSSAASAYNNYATALLNIQMNDKMDAGAKATAMKTARETYIFAMQASYKLANQPVPDFSSLLDFEAPPPGSGTGSGGTPTKPNLPPEYGGLTPDTNSG